MKKYLAVIAIVLLGASCGDNESRHCWNCTFTYSGIKPDTTGDTTLCNFTETDMELRQDRKFDATPTGWETWMITNCRKL